MSCPTIRQKSDVPIVDLALLACPVCKHIHQAEGFCGWKDCGCRG